MDLIIFEDDKKAISLLSTLVLKYNNQKAKEAEKISIVLSTDNYDEVIEYCKRITTSVAFLIDLDIYGIIEGFRLGENIKSIDETHVIIYCTVFEKLILEYSNKPLNGFNFIIKKYDAAFEAQLIDYLTKSIIHVKSHNYFILNYRDYKNYKIEYSNIILFQKIKSKDYAIVSFTENGILVESMFHCRNFKDLLKSLDDSRFCRCYQSAIVNKHKILGIKGNDLILTHNLVCPYLPIYYKPEKGV